MKPHAVSSQSNRKSSSSSLPQSLLWRTLSKSRNPDQGHKLWYSQRPDREFTNTKLASLSTYTLPGSSKVQGWLSPLAWGERNKVSCPQGGVHRPSESMSQSQDRSYLASERPGDPQGKLRGLGGVLCRNTEEMLSHWRDRTETWGSDTNS